MNPDHPSAFARQLTLTFRKPVPESELKNRIESLLLKLGRELTGPGNEIVGHIKGLLTPDIGGHVMFNMTSLREGVRSKGDVKERIDNAEFKVNIILYGAELHVIEAVFKNMLDASLSNCSNLSLSSVDSAGL